MKWLRLGFPLPLLALVACTAAAQEEQNGLQVSVSRKTMARNDEHMGSAYFNEEHIDRTMALHVIVKNVSMKPMPEGEIDYSLLTHKSAYYSNLTQLQTGKAKLPALQPAESTDVIIGSAEVNGYRDLAGQRKDKLDYQVIIKQDGKQTAKVSSMEGFDAAAAHATKVSTPKG